MVNQRLKDGRVPSEPGSREPSPDSRDETALLVSDHDKPLAWHELDDATLGKFARYFIIHAGRAEQRRAEADEWPMMALRAMHGGISLCRMAQEANAGTATWEFEDARDADGALGTWKLTVKRLRPPSDSGPRARSKPMTSSPNTLEDGRVPDGTRLSSTTEPQEGLRPTGFDPSRWQPIETAPKDSRDILAYSQHGCTGTMLVRHVAPCDFLTEAEAEEWARQGVSNEDMETEDWFVADFLQGSRLSPDCHPTHWMPLPAPPEPGK